MQHPPEPLDKGIGELPLKKRGKVGFFRTARTNRAAQRTSRPLGERLDMARLGLDVGFADVDLHVQRAVEAASKHLGLIAPEVEFRIECGDIGEPGVPQRAADDEMQMGVKKRGNGYFGGGRTASCGRIITTGELTGKGNHRRSNGKLLASGGT